MYSATRTIQIRGLDPRSGYARLTACHWTLTNPHLTHHTSKQASPTLAIKPLTAKQAPADGGGATLVLLVGD